MTDSILDHARDSDIEREVRTQLVEHAQALLWRMLVGGVFIGVMFALAGVIRFSLGGLFLGAVLGSTLGALGGALVTLVRICASHQDVPASSDASAAGPARDDGDSSRSVLEQGAKTP